jgi:mxaJ protein
MYSRFLRTGAALVAAWAGLALGEPAELRVCADPDNLPYSHADGSGFENRIARVIADELGARLAYDWLPQIRGYVRKTLGEGRCDVFIGVPSEFERLLTTKPYYRSSYAFVSRDAGAPVRSFDDARLARLTIGVQLVGDDLAATPPGHALAARGMVDNVRGYPVMGEGPAAQRMVQAVARGELDVAVVWGPQAGYHASRAGKLPVALAGAPPALRGIPFEYSISMGVKRGNRALRDALDAAIERRRAEIDAILAAYHVPRTDLPPR